LCGVACIKPPLDNFILFSDIRTISHEHNATVRQFFVAMSVIVLVIAITETHTPSKNHGVLAIVFASARIRQSNMCGKRTLLSFGIIFIVKIIQPMRGLYQWGSTRTFFSAHQTVDDLIRMFFFKLFKVLYILSHFSNDEEAGAEFQIIALLWTV
jgi:hypothetical protein